MKTYANEERLQWIQTCERTQDTYTTATLTTIGTAHDTMHINVEKFNDNLII